MKKKKLGLEIELIINKSAKKVFDKNKNLEEKFLANIKSFYIENKFNIDIKKLKTYRNLYRMRINDFRIVYKLENGEIKIIEVITVASRGQIYKDIK